MPRTAAEILEDALKLPVQERHWIAETLLAELDAMSDEEFAAWRKGVGEPEPGYDEWARAHIEKALADDSPGVPHEQVMREMDQMIQRAKREKLKETA